MEVVRWLRAGAKPEDTDPRAWTKYHLVTTTFNDDIGRTGCGKRYPRYRASYRPFTAEGLPLADICRSCLLAMGGVVPGEMLG